MCIFCNFISVLIDTFIAAVDKSLHFFLCKNVNY